MEPKKYLSVKDMPKDYPFFTQGSLRHMIYENKNNIKKTMIKIGGRLFFDVQRFENWIDEQRMEK